MTTSSFFGNTGYATSDKNNKDKSLNNMNNLIAK